MAAARKRGPLAASITAAKALGLRALKLLWRGLLRESDHSRIIGGCALSFVAPSACVAPAQKDKKQTRINRPCICRTIANPLKNRFIVRLLFEEKKAKGAAAPDASQMK